MTACDDRDTIRHVGLFTVNTPVNPIYKRQKRTQRDKEQEELAHRREASARLYEPMSCLLRQLTGNFTYSQLLELASRLGPQKRLRVDRGAMRRKTLLICWFCENFPELIHCLQCPLQLERADEPATVQRTDAQDFDPFDLLEEWEAVPDVWF
jgi:hypothetical protein